MTIAPNTPQKDCERKLTKVGFTNFDGLAQPVDYCYLVDNIEKIMAIAKDYNHHVEFTALHIDEQKYKKTTHLIIGW